MSQAVQSAIYHYHHQWLYSPWPPHTESFVIYLRRLVGPLWTNDQTVAKASTYTGHHNTETHRQASMPRERFEPTFSLTKRQSPTP
jgi:hypothetical protein